VRTCRRADTPPIKFGKHFDALGKHGEASSVDTPDAERIVARDPSDAPIRESKRPKLKGYEQIRCCAEWASRSGRGKARNSRPFCFEGQKERP